MADLILTIDTTFRHFDHIFDIYSSSLNNLYEFTNVNIDQINVTNVADGHRLDNVIPVDPTEDPMTLMKIYHKQADSCNELRSMAKSDLDATVGKITELRALYGQDNPETVSNCLRAYNLRADKIDNIWSYHETVLSNKHN